MTKIYQEVQTTVTEQELITIECDRCKKHITVDDVVEWQECISWSTTGGFGSVWGDGTQVSVDLCQQCTYDLFSEFATRYQCVEN